MKSSASRDLAIRQELSTILDEYGEQEREVLLVIARRLLAGQRTIGKLDVHTDLRDWRKERSEELADALVYSAIGEFAKSERHGRWCKPVEPGACRCPCDGCCEQEKCMQEHCHGAKCSK